MADDSGIYSADAVQKIGQSLSKGGIWEEDKITLEAEWKGEKPESKSSAVGLGRNTSLKDAKDQIRKADISDELVKAISVVVGNSLLKQMGLEKGETIKSYLDKHKQSTESDVRKWIADTSAALRKNPDEAPEALQHRLSLLEAKIDNLQEVMTNRASEERELISLALKTVEEARTLDEETESRSSNINKLEERKRALEREIETLAATAIASSSLRQSVTKETSSKKKVGKFSSTVI